SARQLRSSVKPTYLIPSKTALLTVLLSSFTVIVLTAGGLAQNNYYVDSSTGSDSNDGSQAHPWRTISHADSALPVGTAGTCTAASGWTSANGIGACIHVASGTYSETIITSKNGSSAARIRYVSDARYAAKLVGTTSSSLIWTSHGKFTDIVGFDFDGTVHPN